MKAFHVLDPSSFEELFLSIELKDSLDKKLSKIEKEDSELWEDLFLEYLLLENRYIEELNLFRIFMTDLCTKNVDITEYQRFKLIFSVERIYGTNFKSVEMYNKILDSLSDEVKNKYEFLKPYSTVLKETNTIIGNVLTRIGKRTPIRKKARKFFF